MFGLGQKVFHGWLDQNFDPSLLTNKLSWEKRKSKWPTQKNNVFQNCQFSIFFVKFHGLVLGLVELIAGKDIDVAQPTGSFNRI